MRCCRRRRRASSPERVAPWTATATARPADQGSPDEVVVGASWLYHLPAYRRLFPAAYLGGLSPMPHPYQRMPLWGQFLARDGRVRQPAGERFLSTVALAGTTVELRDAFPLTVLTTSAPLRALIGPDASAAPAAGH